AETNEGGNPFIKRDGYDTLVQQVRQRRKRPGTSTVKLFHQPGSGGTTLAMHVLWDLRKTFRCAVLTGPTSDMSNVAEEVVHLFTAGSQGHQNTVLLLVNDEHILENLQDSIMKRIAEMQIDTYKHVAVLLSCVRKDEVLPGVARNYGLYATIGGREIEVDANLRRSLWKSRQVSFYLGFTIRGPVAFDIQTKLTEKDHNPKMTDAFAVLHVDTCGDFVEQATEVTSSHVKLFQPTFSPRGVMIRMKLGFSKVERTETSRGSVIIPKPSPDRSLQMQDHFFLTTDTNMADVQPDKLKLRYERRNYFEVFIRDADNDFSLKLENKQKKNSEKDTVWICTIRKGDYQTQGLHHEASGDFIERHFSALIQNARDTPAILDQLRERGVISHEYYKSTLALPTPQSQMRQILTSVKSSESTKKIFYEIINGMESLRCVITDLEKSKGANMQNP
ncbi:hypothetical protein INR49_029377, partial [Caranx melampygus]